MRILFSLFLSLLIYFSFNLFPLAAHAALPTEFEKTQVVGGLDDPTTMRFAPNGDIYIAEQSGAIKIFRNGGLLPTPVITVDTINDHEKGLLGIELDNNFATNGYLYASYTHSSGFARLSRFTVVNDVASPASEVVFFESDQVASIFHNANDIQHGPDGKIWWSVGDNLVTGNSQSLQTIHGKIARFDLDGSSANDNPWHGDGDKVDEIYALGLRNPFRFTFLPNGKAVVGDVGGALWEEINIVGSGVNFGWPQYEGDCGSCGYANPVFAYPHDGQNSAVSALAFYSDDAFPLEYQNVLFYGDYARGIIRYLKFDENYQSVLSDHDFDDAAGTVTDLQVGPDGHLYYVSIFGSSIYKIAPSGGNRTPSVKAAVDPIAGLAPLSVQFSSAGTLDPDGDVLSYEWDFGDGNTSNEENPSHEYTLNGTYNVTLTVSDGDKQASANVTVTVGNRLPTATIDTPIDGTKYNAGDTISFSGSASDPEDGDLPASAFSWKVVFHHAEHTHPYINDINGVKNGTFNIGRDASNEFNTWYRIHLTVTDSGGLQHTIYKDVFPNLVNLTIQTDVVGGKFTVNGNLHSEPYTHQEVVGVDYGVSVQSPQTISGSKYRFKSWSDGGAQTHVYRIPANDSVLTANLFEALPVPSPWANTDIGSPALIGGADYDAETEAFTIDAGGEDIWQTKDQFHYVYQPLSGDGEIVARVTSLSPTDAWTKSGVMIKESATAGATYAMVSVTPANGIVMQYNFTGNAGPRPSYNLPIWLKLTRVGNQFTSYYSTNGTSWTQLGQATVNMSSNATIGLFSTAHTNSALATTVFDNVSTLGIGGPGNTAPTADDQSISTVQNTPVDIALTATDPHNDPLTYSIVTQPTNGTLSGTAPNVTYTPNTDFTGSDSFTFKANDGEFDSNIATVNINVTGEAGTLPSEWQTTDIGHITPGDGNASYDSLTQTFSVTGGGHDIWDTHDDFRFVYQPLVGDGEIVARVTSQTNTHTHAKAGVMIKESTTPFAPYTMIGITPANGYKMQWTFQLQSISGGLYTLANAWVKLNRTGNVFTTYKSTDGVSWTFVGQKTVTMNSNALVGLFVTSHNSGALSTATFDNVSVIDSSGPVNTPPTANNQSVATSQDTPTDITLTASDAEADPLTYSIVTQPSNGTLSGTAPNVTYTPDSGYTGADSFTFKANDGTVDSNTATVSITVNAIGEPIPSPWLNTDIGGATPSGSASYDTSSQTFTVSGGGEDIWQTVDQFHYVYQELTGDGEIQARVTSQTNTDPWAKAGVMIKNAAVSGEAYALMSVTPENGYAFQHNFIWHVSGTNYAFPNGWVKIKRVGDVLTGYTSVNGVDWDQVGQTTLTLNNTVTVGLFVNSHNTSNVSTATFDNVLVTGLSAANNPPTAESQSLSTLQDTPLNITLSGSDLDGDTLTYSIIDGPSNGILSGTAPDVIYTPNTGYVGNDSFTFKANDGEEDSNIATVSITVTQSSTTLPTPWVNQDIGHVTPGPGSASYDIGTETFTVKGGGHDIWDTHDDFQFVHQELSGDGEIVARVTSQTNTNGHAKAGVMIKESTTPFAPYTMIGLTPSNGFKFQWTFEKQSSTGTSYTSPNNWVKLKRVGNVFTAYKSENGTNWTQVGTEKTVPMSSNALVGLFVTSHNSSAISTVTFDNVEITASDPQPNTAPSANDLSTSTTVDTSVDITLAATDPQGDVLSYSVVAQPTSGTLSGTAPNLTYEPNSGFTGTDSFTYKANDGEFDSNTATVTITVTGESGILPSEWQTTDIGHVTPGPGDASYDVSTQTFSLTGGGHDIWDTHDDFRFVYQPLVGDGEIVARVTSQTNTHSHTKAGVMIKESTDAFAPYTFIGVTPENGYKMQWTFLLQSISGGTYTFPNAWMKLNRTGNVFTTYKSTDGLNWIQVGQKTVSMNSNALVGLFVTSHDSGELSTATFDNVSITP